MSDYIMQTRFATSSLIDLISSEENTLKDLQVRLDGLKKHHDILYEDFQWKDYDPWGDFDDTKIMFAFAKQASFYQNQIEPVLKKIKQVTSSIDAKENSIKVLAGALLQIAKQGISTVHGKLDHCPDGRTIKDEPIKNIIWQGRNQSLHYEEGNLRKPIRDCFQRIGIPLKEDNLAKEVINLLNWKTYEQYEEDLALLLEDRRSTHK